MFWEQEQIKRVIIEGVKPEIDGGRFPVKRTVGETLIVGADIFTDGHDAVSGVLRHRRAKASEWNEVPLRFVLNDRWVASFALAEVGRYVYTFSVWVDPFIGWRRDLLKKADAGQDVSIDLLAGAELVEAAAGRAREEDANWLRARVQDLRTTHAQERQISLATDEVLLTMMTAYPDRRFATDYEKELEVVVDREKARFSAWYEMFPRSCSDAPGKHGTFKDCERRLRYIAEMGFDVLYFPPIHPIGLTHRKGRNNSAVTDPDDPGSPWAIGAQEGGHRGIHPQLGTLEDFRDLMEKARELDIEIALDIAFQCSPDHPYAREHPEWFKRRPDGSIRYAENPPKKYEDIFPLDFESACWEELVQELRDVVCFWIAQGVRIFRVDNPHTKPFAFWEWLIGSVKEEHPEVIFLAEAFTRPKVMYRLAKLGFTQSYTYFAWRNSAWEIRKYLTELTQTEAREFFRPNFWPNTPDILTEYLQLGGRPAFIIRLILAATLAASYGIYGPAFELCEGRPREAGSEEYLDSEKYQIRHWDLESPHSLQELISGINRVRRENPALHGNESLRFHPIDNEQMLCYTKNTPDHSNIILVAVNLDPHHTQSGWAEIALDQLGLDPRQPFQVHDLLGESRYLWYGPRNYLELNPYVMPAHVFRIRKKVRTERDFDYYL
ncbi:MAG: alpha-1,4-glucan--maltose-1-phosphate maltosyltransferase [Desulfobacteraceae bacterium]|nr:MAG: alpha-1,4-glucan--maltose-1-phosphate maltosyltransferase [Desulfobacteraceae bacterium]